MFGSTVLDVALGLVFLYLLLSLLCTGINELIETALKQRAANLERGIKELLLGPGPTAPPAGAAPPAPAAAAPAADLVARFYNHPLISPLYQGRYGEPGTALPSYIPARTFALAVLDLARPADSPAPPAPAAGGTPARSGAAGTTARPAAAAAPPTPSLVQSLRDSVDQNPALTEAAKKALLTLIDAAGDDLVQARRNIEGWFDAAMGRVSGWYKRWVRVLTLLVGLALAVGTNADSFAVADALARDPALRASVAAAAAAAAAKPADPTGPPTVQQVAAEVRRVQGFGWPVGWDVADDRQVPPAGCYGAWAQKAFGWVVTLIAITLGAPFWFDTLNRIIDIRAAGRPEGKART